MSDLEERLLFDIKVLGLPEPIREYSFHPERKWRSDFAYLDTSPPLLIEVEGGTFQYGRHQRPAGFDADCEKYNTAAMIGYAVMRFSGTQVLDGSAVNTIEQWIKERYDGNK